MDYIFLDKDERNKFITHRHEYLIEQIQYLTPQYFNKNQLLNGSINISLDFNNCVKDFFWFCITGNNLDVNDYSNYTSSVSYYNNLNTLENILLYRDHPLIQNIILTAYNRMVLLYNRNIDINKINMSWFLKSEINSIIETLKNIREYDVLTPIIKSQILINGKILLDRDSLYTSMVIPYQKYNNNGNNGLNVYSFSLNPEVGQPSGSLNFSVLSDIKINLDIDTSIGILNENMTLKIIGRSYNILRIFSGMGACIYNC
jgi:hypothetical protein